MTDLDSEAALEGATLDLFARLKWQTANCYDETVGPDDRDIPAERLYDAKFQKQVILWPRGKITPCLPPHRASAPRKSPPASGSIPRARCASPNSRGARSS